VHTPTSRGTRGRLAGQPAPRHGLARGAGANGRSSPRPRRARAAARPTPGIRSLVSSLHPPSRCGSDWRPPCSSRTRTILAQPGQPLSARRGIRHPPSQGRFPDGPLAETRRLTIAPDARQDEELVHTMAAGLLYSAARRLVAYDDKENAVAALRSLSPRRPNYKEWVRRARSSIPELQC